MNSDDALLPERKPSVAKDSGHIVPRDEDETTDFDEIGQSAQTIGQLWLEFNRTS
jgi:hypothetical protein